MTLRVKFEIVPFGVEEEAYEINRLDIFNKGELVKGTCRYGIIYMDADADEFGLVDREVIHHRVDGALVLAEKVLNEINKL